MQSSPYESPYQAAAPQLEYVSVGPRFLAVLIDGIILMVVGGIISAGLRAPAVAGTLEAVIAFAYLIIMEATQGATIGKKLVGLRVVKEDGSPISWNESIIRNLLRIVDSLFVYLVGAILVWNSPTRQRLGDRVAKTVVIRSR
jgi:uncharacterized RDD family membrane protein YckC